MKLVTYSAPGTGPRLGVLADDGIIDLHNASDGNLSDNMLNFLQAGDAAMALAREASASAVPVASLDQAQLQAPVTHPSKIVAIGLNYMDHIREAQLPVPEVATMFCKYPSSIIGPDAEIQWSTSLTNQVDYEAELAVVIGKVARNVSESDAYEHIAGYMNCNDVSARDLQFTPGDQWLRGKCLDTFCPLGPYLVTRDEIPDPHALSIRCKVNDELVQDSNTGEMIYRIPYLIQYLSAAFTLFPGDIIATGTPHGVGAFSKPPRWLKTGDRVSIEIEGLGTLENTCVELS